MKKETQLYIIERLENLQKWDCITGDRGPYASGIDWEKDNKMGCWIHESDIEELIKELENKL